MKKIFGIEERDHHTLNLIFDEGVRIVVQKDTGPYAVGDMYGEPETVVGVLAEDVVGVDEAGDEVIVEAGTEVVVEATDVVAEPKTSKKK